VVPSTIIHARYLCKKLRTKFPRVKIIVGLWGMTTENKAESAQRLRDSGTDEVVVSLADAVEQIMIGIVFSSRATQACPRIWPNLGKLHGMFPYAATLSPRTRSLLLKTSREIAALLTTLGLGSEVSVSMPARRCVRRTASLSVHSVSSM